MSLRALWYAYLLGGVTFLPLLLLALAAVAIYTSTPPPPPPPPPPRPPRQPSPVRPPPRSDSDDDTPPTRRGWLTVRRTFQESTSDASYVSLVRSYLDARSKDPKRSRPKDTWYVVLKAKVLYLYQDESVTDCEAAIELGSHDVLIYPEGLPDGELFTRRNAVCLRPRANSRRSPSKEIADQNGDGISRDTDGPGVWFIFVRSCVDMEDWYLALVHASDHPSGTPTLTPLRPVFLPSEMNHLVTTLDEQPDVIPMRWFNALLGRLFYSFYRTQAIESFIIARLMKKLSKVKRPAFLVDVAVTQFSVGNRAPTFSKPMLKELTKEGDASLEVGLLYKGEIRATVEATAVINLGPRFKSYTVKLVLAVVLRELEGNLLVKVKRPPSSRIWYAFTKPPRMAINVEPIVSDRQITWSMILNTIEAKIEEIIVDSVVLPNMDDISFFDSIEYEHRGGVWADAVRLEKPVSQPTPETVAKPSTPGVAPQPSEETGPSLVARAAPSEAEPMVETPSSDIVATLLEKTSTATTTTRRRSWFYSAADAPLDSAPEKEVEGDAHESREQDAKPDTSLALPPGDTCVMQPLDTLDDDRDDHECLVPRPSSARSRSSRTHSVSSSVGGDESFNYLSDSSTTSKSPRLSLATSTTSSFLSTLKSKAGDKQALSNTAKEAMRKWGVNWGLKRENGGNPSLDNAADAGTSDDRHRSESMHGRQSYADLRAAVIERREQQTERGGESTLPIAIPQASGGGKGRSTSASGVRNTSQSGGSNLSRSLGDDTLKDRDVGEDGEDHPLIHTQPSQGRTMTIPGIHASHKGDVMSMGNVAPVTAAPKGPTMQSVYRLWKSPSLTAQPGEEAQASSPSTSPRTNDGDRDVAPLVLAPEAPSPPSRVPPPLPPRTMSSVAVRHATDGQDEPVSAASQALRSIASRDGTRRLSAEGDGGGGPDCSSRPPLPPRRHPDAVVPYT